MRKVLLTAFMAPFIAFAQMPQASQAEREVKISPNEIQAMDAVSPVRTQANIPTAGSYNAENTKEFLFKVEQIGETTYDLQTNSALARRVVLSSDGKVSAVWSFATDNSPFITRGTAYNSFDGTEWGPSPIQRLEDGRAGWNNIAVWNDNGTEREVVVSHYATHMAGEPTGGIYVMVNDEFGSPDFTIVNKLDVANNTGPFWPRIAVTNNYLHMFAAWNRERADSVKDGILRPNTYFRFNLTSNEWVEKEVLLPLYDSTRVLYGISDSYFMDAKDDAVAIVSGGMGQDLFMWKSLDNGDTWTGTIVDSFPIPRFDGTQLIDTTDCNTGSVSIILDDNLVAHVFSDFSRMLNVSSDETTYSFFPASNGIRYWSETNQTQVMIGGAPDMNSDGVINIPGSQVQSAANNGFRYMNTGLSAFPSAGLSSDGTIYCVYSALNEEALSAAGPVFRDVYVVFKNKNEDRWSGIQPLIESKQTEDMFASCARIVDDNLHVVWQRDDFVGTNVIHNHTSTLNKIMYAAVPTQIIKEYKLAFNRTSVEETAIEKASVYPNPASDLVTFGFNLNSSQNVRLIITNVLGQQVINSQVGTMPSGQNQVQLNTSALSSGIYIYSIEAGSQTSTGRLVIE